MQDKDPATPEAPQPDGDAQSAAVERGEAITADPAAAASHEEQIAEAQRKVEELHEQALRAAAELENTRKRADKEIRRIRQYALESFATELLVVKDNLERGLDDQSGVGTVESLREGVRLTLKTLEQVFEKFGIEEVSPMGQVFDPALHQAMSMVASDEHAPNTVIEVTQKGYLLNQRLIRPAMVMVSKSTAAD